MLVVTRYSYLPLLAVMACIFLSGASAFGQDNTESEGLTFRIKEPDVAVPDGVPSGQYRRIIQPFDNWTIICDENFKSKQRVCNIGQSIVNEAGEVVFSWSLAASENGKPFMIFRIGADAQPKGSVQVKLSGRRQPVNIKIEGCNRQICMAKSPVGPVFREHINKQSSVGISYETTDNRTITIPATFKGLSDALSAIN
ncbi:invasion associated locus B family protein [Pseudochrobactrum sp. MP213Fo]|uniref:invasion associated locus B family protein n=1 Tax=Pseudochrobactrum sp. MP213Fo TaxID=3022250 RepID=UPI003BA3B0A2